MGLILDWGSVGWIAGLAECGLDDVEREAYDVYEFHLVDDV